MQKNRFFFFFIFASLPFLHLHTKEVLPEVKISYFYPTGSKFKKIYCHAKNCALEGSIGLSKHLYPWASAGMMYASGFSIGERDKTKFYMVPIDLGLKYLFDFKNVKPYLGSGLIIANGYIWNDSPFVSDTRFYGKFGGIFKSGCIISIDPSFLCTLFLDYSYVKFDVSSARYRYLVQRQMDLSGLFIGASLGYFF